MRNSVQLSGLVYGLAAMLPFTHRSQVLALGLLAIMASACEPPATSPTPMMVIARNADGQYRPQQVQVRTLTRPVTLEGTTARFLGGARFIEDIDDPAVQSATTIGEYIDAITKDAGSPVKAHLYDQNGVLWPSDFHSWNLATSYYLLERAADYFRDTSAVPESALSTVDVYYFPEVRFQEDLENQADNASWFSLIRGLLFLRYDQIQTVPLPINRGVMVHEYAHRIFNERVYRGARMPAPLVAWDTIGATPGINLLRSLDEGFADYHAVAESCRSAEEGGYGCDSRFMADSFGEAVATERDITLEARACFSRPMWIGLSGENHAQFAARGANYQLGTVIASALWQAGQNAGQQHAMEQALLDAYSSTDPSNPGIAELIDGALHDQLAFSLPAVMDRIVAHVPDPGLRTFLCFELMDHLNLNHSGLPSCPLEAQRGDTCPVWTP